MPLAPGTRIGAYEVIAGLGAGGMGEVYRAHDARLRRDVAIKVLPADVAADPDRLRRFEQEARSTAALNHPNILAVYDVGRDADQAFVVAELLEGQTLREAIAAGPMPVRKALEYAIQITHGLAAAHEKGIVHRDLKPENLFITTDERVKILDFGLAKLADTRPSGASTVLAAATEPGMVLGTIGYMAPEQVRAVAVDHRADLFSFGAVLYEMLAGRRAFVGETAADTMTAILKESTAPLEDSGRVIPPVLARVVERCLDKQPARRFQSASDLAFALQSLGSESRSGMAAPAVAGSSRSSVSAIRPWLMTAASLVFGAIAGAGLWKARSPEPIRSPLLELEIATPPGHVATGASALSPNGSHLLLTVRPIREDSDEEPDERGRSRDRIWMRSLTTTEARFLPETEGARQVFWSPDGTEIGFFARNRLRVLTLATGRVRSLADVTGVRIAGTWNSNGLIVYSTETGVPLHRVDASGKTAAAPFPNALGYRPVFLPDQTHVVFGGPPTLGRSKGLFALNTQTGDVKKLRDDGTEPKYAAGHLLFVLDGALLAQPFDADGLKLSGQPVQIAAEAPGSGSSGPNFTVNSGGTLVFLRPTEVTRGLAWYSRNGARTPVNDAGDWLDIQLSPDGLFAVGTRNEPGENRADIWLHDATKAKQRLFVSGRTALVAFPIWGRDSRTVRYFRDKTGWVEREVTGGDERIWRPAIKQAGIVGTATALTEAGGVVAFGIKDGNRDVYYRPPGSDELRFIGQTNRDENLPALSPDERWIAYLGWDDSGTRALVVERFPDGGRRVRVPGRGTVARWRKDGGELFYVESDHRLFAVSVTERDGTLQLGPPSFLFQSMIPTGAGVGSRACFDATPDGSRFIACEPREERRGDRVAVLVNWQSKTGR